MRTLPALAVSTIVLATLTACTGGPFSAACQPFAHSGPASSLVSATGVIGNSPDVDFPTPIISDGIQVESIIIGDGRTVGSGDTITVKYSLYNAATGASLGSSGYAHTGDLLTLGATNANDVVSDSLECATVGSRVAIVASALAVHGGQGDASIGVGPDDSIVYVIDIVDAFPSKASGAAQPARSGLPTVVTAPNGAPGITIPRVNPPAEFTVAPLVIGAGKKLDATTQALIKYTAVNWQTGSVTDSTWNTGRATLVPLNGPTSFPASIIDALIGQTIGTQLLVVVPPADSGDSTTATLVYVIDVLGSIPTDY